MERHRAEAADVICRILAAAGGRMAGKTRLNKAFYYAHLFYWRHSDGFLTGYPLVKAPNGPVVDDLDGILADLVACGRLRVFEEPCGPYLQTGFELSDRTPFGCDDAAGHAIELAVQWVQGRSAADLSEETHEFIRDWNALPMGQEIEIYRDLVSPDELRAIRTASAGVADCLIAGG